MTAEQELKIWVGAHFAITGAVRSGDIREAQRMCRNLERLEQARMKIAGAELHLSYTLHNPNPGKGHPDGTIVIIGDNST